MHPQTKQKIERNANRKKKKKKNEMFFRENPNKAASPTVVGTFFELSTRIYMGVHIFSENKQHFFDIPTIKGQFSIFWPGFRSIFFFPV